MKNSDKSTNKLIGKLKLSFLLFFLFIAQYISAQSFTIYSRPSIDNNNVQIQSGDTINRKDTKGNKQGLWIYFNKKTKKINSLGNYKNGKRVGLWKKFRPNGEKLSEFHYQKGKKIGLAKSFYPNGNLQEEGYWKVDTWIGNYYYYYPNGKPCYQWKYDDNGNRTGTQKYFHDNGKLKIEGNWAKGLRDGVLKEYYEDGSLKSEKKFIGDKMDTLHVKNYKKAEKHAESNLSTIKPNSQNIATKTQNNNLQHNNLNNGVFNPNGYNKLYNIKNKKIEKNGLFKNGRLFTGKYYIYNKQDSLTRILIYKKGKRIKDIKMNK